MFVFRIHYFALIRYLCLMVDHCIYTSKSQVAVTHLNIVFWHMKMESTKPELKKSFTFKLLKIDKPR